jgi:hypothetical protein
MPVNPPTRKTEGGSRRGPKLREARRDLARKKQGGQPKKVLEAMIAPSLMTLIISIFVHYPMQEFLNYLQ